MKNGGFMKTPGNLRLACVYTYICEHMFITSILNELSQVQYI